VQGPQYFSPDDEGNNIAVWDIKSGDLLRTFSTTGENETPSSKKTNAVACLEMESR
jgi:translation initiation factor 3 subunit B